LSADSRCSAISAKFLIEISGSDRDAVGPDGSSGDSRMTSDSRVILVGESSGGSAAGAESEGERIGSGGDRSSSGGGDRTSSGGDRVGSGGGDRASSKADDRPGVVRTSTGSGGPTLSCLQVPALPAHPHTRLLGIRAPDAPPPPLLHTTQFASGAVLGGDQVASAANSPLRPRVASAIAALCLPPSPTPTTPLPRPPPASPH
jgi:hypothetical protein